MSLVSTASRRLSIIDETLQSVSPPSCELFMHWTPPHFSFSVLDRNRNKFIALCEYRIMDKLHPDDIRNIVSQEEILSWKFARTCLAVYTHKSSLIPAALFSPEKSSGLLAQTARPDADDILCADHLKLTDAVHLYALPGAVTDIIKELFPATTLVHTGTVFIESELLRNKHKEARAIAVNVRQQVFEVVVTEGNKLLLYNSFYFQTSEDFIYYLLHIMEQLALNPESAVLTLMGDIEKQQAVYLITSKYVRNIVFAERPGDMQFSYGFDRVPQHSHNILLNEYLCVS